MRRRGLSSEEKMVLVGQFIGAGIITAGAIFLIMLKVNGYL